MKIKFPVPFLLLLLIAATGSSYASANTEALGRKAVSENASEARPAIAELRAMGPAGLNSLFELYRADIDRRIANPLEATTSEWVRLSTALDAVSQQKDSYLSGLYWYTDLQQAQAVAKSSGKPILSLRLLGNLNEEFSCANSRFSRTVLYSNEQVAQALNERFILHWQSVRPAPRITIDFGDGRKIERTVTGNSIHYILDANGQVIDALPGLYGPAAFLRSLNLAEEAFRQSAKAGDDKAIPSLSAYHRDRLNKSNLDWLQDTQRLGGKIPQGIVIRRRADGTPAAIEITSLTVTKTLTEASILTGMTAGTESLRAITDEAAWNKIGRLHLADAQLDARSIGLIQRQTQNLFLADAAKTRPEAALAKLIAKLQLSVALDSVRNEYLLHPKLHAWLASGLASNDLNAFNDKVYAELFLTPKSDPWLGLYSPEVYTALDGAGLVR
jgi:hypothetical protein